MWLAKQSHSNECFFYAGSCRVFCGIFGPLSSGWTEGNMPPLLWPPSQISSSKDWIPVKKNDNEVEKTNKHEQSENSRVDETSK